MKDKSIILATDTNGNDITIQEVELWVKENEKDKLSQFIYDRLYGRYLKPFNYRNEEYIANYKNGFAIMASCCLLIETYVSFREPVFRDTNGKSERCFGWFFLTESIFSDFSKNGLSVSEYTDLSKRLKNKGIPRDFYINLRCGILHNSETRNGWKIRRDGEFYDEANKKINATKFMNRLKCTILDFKKRLDKSDIKDEVWTNYLNRLQDIIDKA
jgi:hypothetical protein